MLSRWHGAIAPLPTRPDGKAGWAANGHRLANGVDSARPLAVNFALHPGKPDGGERIARACALPGVKGENRTDNRSRDDHLSMSPCLLG